MAFIVVYDANVLYPDIVRNVLVRLAKAGVCRARWTDEILDEMFGNLKKHRPDLDPLKLDRTRELMCKAVPDCIIDGYSDLIPSLKLPDPKDRHVLAAAIRAGAQLIVTYNLKDFPDEYLAQWDIEAKHPDGFVEDAFHIDGRVTHQVISEIAGATRKPKLTIADVIDAIEERGLTVSAALLRR